jgi:hypothetical protein
MADVSRCATLMGHEGEVVPPGRPHAGSAAQGLWRHARSPPQQTVVWIDIGPAMASQSVIVTVLASGCTTLRRRGPVRSTKRYRRRVERDEMTRNPGGRFARQAPAGCSRRIACHGFLGLPEIARSPCTPPLLGAGSEMSRVRIRFKGGSGCDLRSMGQTIAVTAVPNLRPLRQPPGTDTMGPLTVVVLQGIDIRLGPVYFERSRPELCRRRSDKPRGSVRPFRWGPEGRETRSASGARMVTGQPSEGPPC